MTSLRLPQSAIMAGPSGDLEYILSYPQHTCTKIPYIIICHPHPLQGGTMANKVVYMIASTFNQQLNAGAIRFNFRGVGRSTGSFDQGQGETEDLKTIAHWIRTYYAPAELWLAGFSFGSYVALRAHREITAQRLLLVAPPVDRFPIDTLSETPTVIIQGEQDEIVSPQAVARWLAEQTYQPQCYWLAETDHFFHGKLIELRQTIVKAWHETT